MYLLKKNSYVSGPAQFRSVSFKGQLYLEIGEIISLEEVMKAESPWWDYCPYKRPESLISAYRMWGYNKKAAVCKAGRGLSPRTKSADTLTLDFLASRTMRNKFVSFKSSNLCYFGIVSSLSLLTTFFFFLRFIYYLFIYLIYFWLHQVLVAAHGIFVETCGIFCCRVRSSL